MGESCIDREIRSLAQLAHRLDLALRAVGDVGARTSLIEQCRAIEWRVNSLATPAPWRVPH